MTYRYKPENYNKLLRKDISRRPAATSSEMTSLTNQNNAYPGTPELAEVGYKLVKREENINSSSRTVSIPRDEEGLKSAIKKLQRIYSSDKNPYRKETMEYISRSRREIWKKTLGYKWVHQKHLGDITLPPYDIGFEYYYEDNYDTVGSVVPSLLEILRKLPSFVSRIQRDTRGERITDPYFHDKKFADIVKTMKRKSPELLKKWLTFPLLYLSIDTEWDRGYEYIINKGYPLQYCFENKQWKKFDIIWNALEPKERLKWGGIPIDLQAYYLTAHGEQIPFQHLDYKTHVMVNPVRAGSVARQLFYFMKKNGGGYESVKYYKKILSETREFDFLQDIFDMIKPDIPDFVFACLEFHKDATEMKLSLERYGHGTDIINEKLAALNQYQFIKILRLVEYDSKKILNHLVRIDNSEIKEKIDTLFTVNFNDLQFYKYVMQMEPVYTNFKNFGHFQKHWLNYITMKTEMEDKMDADESFLNVIDQLDLVNEIKSISKAKPLKKEYGTYTTVREFMEYHVQRLKKWSGISFEYKSTIEDFELKQMVKMRKHYIPFYSYTIREVTENIDKHYCPQNEYLIVRSGEEIVAFQVFELKMEKEADTNKLIYIAWEAAKEGGYASALKVLTMSHALDTKRKLLTLDLCGGHWFSHPSARKMNLDLGFRYNHLFNGGKYDEQANLICKKKYHNCPISKLKSIYFKGKRQKETMGIESHYKTKRKNFRDAFFNADDDLCYPMSLEVSVERLVQMFVYVQEKHEMYISNRYKEDILNKKNRGLITAAQAKSKKTRGKAAKIRDAKRANAELTGRTKKNDPQLKQEDNQHLQSTTRMYRGIREKNFEEQKARKVKTGHYKEGDHLMYRERNKEGVWKWFEIVLGRFLPKKGPRRARYETEWIDENDKTYKYKELNEKNLIKKQEEYAAWRRYEIENPGVTYNDYYEELNSGSSSTTVKRKRDSRSRSPPTRRRPPPVRDDESKNDDAADDDTEVNRVSNLSTIAAGAGALAGSLLANF